MFKVSYFSPDGTLTRVRYARVETTAWAQKFAQQNMATTEDSFELTIVFLKNPFGIPSHMFLRSDDIKR